MTVASVIDSHAGGGYPRGDRLVFHEHVLVRTMGLIAMAMQISITGLGLIGLPKGSLPGHGGRR